MKLYVHEFGFRCLNFFGTYYVHILEDGERRAKLYKCHGNVLQGILRGVGFLDHLLYILYLLCPLCARSFLFFLSKLRIIKDLMFSIPEANIR
jgi:hypothetical protein